ncbi:MAG: DUF2283 domain-containing protein [Aquificaceae bacterium]
MWIEYYEDTDTLYIKLKDEPVYESEHLEEFGIVLDYNQRDEVIGLEIFGWSRGRVRRTEKSSEGAGVKHS